MNNVKFVIYHPELEYLSDRTIRSLLKKLSSVLRELQTREVLQFINSCDISPSEKQSLRDRLKGPLNHIEAYYLEKLQKGSVELTIVLTGFGLWLLQQTIGESIKSAWQQTEAHKNLVSYLSGDYRKEVIEKNIDMVLANWTLDSYLVDEVIKEADEEDNLNVRVNLSTPTEVKNRIEENSGLVTIEKIISESKKSIAALEKHLDE